MPSPVTPHDFEQLLPSPESSFCERFVRNLLRVFPQRFLAYITYERNPDGTLSDAFIADVRALACFGGDGDGDGDGTGSGLSAPTISATDGAHLDKVVITWAAIVGATNYEVFRNNTNSTSGAISLGTTAGATSFDDMTVDQTTIYYYWVRAINSSNALSAYSNADSGFAASELPTVTTLNATRGFSAGVGTGSVRLVWVPVTGGYSYSIYRSETPVFSETNRIDTNRVPYDNRDKIGLGPSPHLVTTGQELVYYDAPPDQRKKYYYWVKARSSTGGSISLESNMASGWVYGDGSGAQPFAASETLDITNDEYVIPAGTIRVWIAAHGSGAGGAGSGPVYGAGAGGAGAVAIGILDVTGSAPKLRVVYTPDSAETSIANSETDGENGTLMEVQFAPDGVAWSTVMTLLAPSGGFYSATGGGLGGDAASGSVVGLSNAEVFDGRAGEPGSGPRGGMSGHHFGEPRTPAANFAFGHPGHGTPTGNTAGSGSNAATAISSRLGGKGISGYVFLTPYNF